MLENGLLVIQQFRTSRASHQLNNRTTPEPENMPGPGPHMMYTLGSGQALMHISNDRFGPHHCVTYAINAFFGPDIGSFSEWLTSTLGLGRIFGSSVESWIHDPLWYVLILGIPLSLLYSWASRFALRKGILDSFSGVGIFSLVLVLIVLVLTCEWN